MSSITVQQTNVIIGVDTHKDQHVAFAIDTNGSRLAEPLEVPATNDGYQLLIEWATGFGPVQGFGVEGCGSYGQGLARFLRRHGYQVREVARPPRRGERRLSGKSDAIDAEHAARLMLTGEGMATPKTADGNVEALRMIKIARDTAVKAHTTTMITLKAVLVTCEHDLRDELAKLSDHKLILACVELPTTGDIGNPGVAAKRTLSALANRYLQLHDEIKLHTRDLKALTNRIAPQMIEQFGIGFDTASEMLVSAGDNTDRVHSEAAFAKLCGACPIPAGSGRTNGRHRLNRGGNRQANAALYRVVIVGMRWHPPTIAYVERRTKEGLSKKEIIRCLKRSVAREIYHLLPPPTSLHNPPSST
jgi:transposase